MFKRLYWLLFFLWGCGHSVSVSLPFDFDSPVEVIKLPEKLHEISGIVLYSKNQIACVQDEKGIIFFYDFKKDKLRNTVPFGPDKDYEAIANVNDTLFVLCSNGVIYEVDSSSSTGYSHKYSTFLSKNNNCEGLCYDSAGNRLLVSCKGKPEKHTAPSGMKVVYCFDLATRTLNEKPCYIIDPAEVKKQLIDRQNTFLRSIFTHQEEKDFQFEPSDICIDPVTSDVYMLSAVGKTMLCLSHEGVIKFAYHLDPDLFKQPEGITFAKNGTMLISDEGRKGKANLIRLKRTTE